MKKKNFSDLRPRTSSLIDLKNNLSDINKYLSYYIFISSQFIKQNKKLIEQNPESLTSVIFRNNNLSKQFNVKLSLLKEHTYETDKFIFDCIFLYCFIVFDNYLKDIYINIQTINNLFKKERKSLVNFKSGIPELRTQETLNQIIKNLKISYNESFRQEHHLTMEYFRYRRNTISHRDFNKRYTGAIKDFIIKNGQDLNNFWQNPQTGSLRIDFTSAKLIFTDKDSIVEIINILRDVSSRLEEQVINKLTEKEWIEFLFSQYKNEVKTYDLNAQEKFLQSFIKFATLKLNKKFNKNDIKQVIY